MGAARKLDRDTKQKYAVIYARFSSHGQQEQSIDGQLRDCCAFAEREGITIVGEYIDRAISAKTDARPDFRRMVADASKKQFQYVIVWKLDRFARNRFDSAIHKAALKKHGVKVLSAMENIADNPEGALLEGILESMAEHYSASLVENVKRGQRESVLKGAHVGGLPPFGFKTVKEGDKLRLVADENKAPIIQYVFEQYAKGVSKKKIMEDLTARGVLNYNGKPLTISCLQNALKNTKYIGKYVFGGTEVPGACDALIDEKTFNKVQEMLYSKSHGKNTKRVRQDYLLHGKAFCGHCGSPLVGDAGTSRHGNVYFYYACGKRKKHHTCDKRNEKKDFLEWYVVEQTIEYVLTPERIEDIAARVVAEYDNNFNDTRINDLERRVKKIDAEVDKLVDMMIELPKKSALKIGEK
jgi:DNA invertase Pin-like site-specific DNA recombinase